MFVIAISGKQGSGKSTLARALCQLPGFASRAHKFAQPLYEMHDKVLEVARDYGLPTPEKDGKLLQLLGVDWGREVYGPDVWANVLVDELVAWGSFPNADDVVVDDMRFPNEMAALRKAFGNHLITVRLECPEPERRVRAEGWRDSTGHASEIALDNAAFDLQFNTGSYNNTSVDDMIQEIGKLMLQRHLQENAADTTPVEDAV